VDSKTCYKNCRLAFPDFISPGALLEEEGIITRIWVEEDPDNIPSDARQVDCQGLILAPGLVDIHNHGALTHDFVAANPKGNNAALQFHAQHGVTSLLATVMTETPEQMRAALQTLAEQKASGELFPNFGGIHVEGPYFHPDKRGAHKLECLRDPVRSEYEKFWELSNGLIRIFTHAPERKGAGEFCRFFHERGCVPAIGHTRASMLEIRRAAAHGARHFVHANNAIDWPLRRTRPEGWLGTEMMGLGALLTHAAFSGEIIADGYHVPVEMMRLFLSAKNPDSWILVSDASPAAGCEPGEYQQGGLKIILKENKLVLSGGGTMDGIPPLGGSATPLLAMIQNWKNWGLGFLQALKMSTLTPARVIGAEKKGLLRAGNDADFILLDDDLNLLATVLAGKTIHSGENTPFGKG
jgi:N-acetylglucosamine-6-phosphate deacetylase